MNFSVYIIAVLSSLVKLDGGPHGSFFVTADQCAALNCIGYSLVVEMVSAPPARSD